MGAHIYVEDSGVQWYVGVLFGYHGLFYGIGATHPRAITFGPYLGIPRPHALDPGNLFRFLFVR